MKYVVFPNSDRKTITVLVGGVRFFSAKFLLERYQEERYFGNGIFEATQEDINKITSEIAQKLVEQNPSVRIHARQFQEGPGVDYPLFKRHLNQDDKWDGKSWSVSLSSFAKNNERNFFYKDKGREHPINNEEIIKDYEWAVELELSVYNDKKTLEDKVFTVIHRILIGQKLEKNYMVNDDAWEGFDFVSEDDLPF